MPKIESVVSDFDGVVTDLQRETQTYAEKFTERLSAELGMTTKDVLPLFETARNKIDTSPGIYGWEYQPPGGGVPIIVAPATADPYIYVRVQANLAISWLRTEQGWKHIPSVSEIPGLLQRLYEECYTFTGYFRDGAEQYLRELHTHSHLTILTNSQTEDVHKKLLLLGADSTIKVEGNAKKYQVDPGWMDMTETMAIPGLPRPVYLRRKTYNDALDAIRQRTGSVDKVIGDIWELDLALPEKNGIQTVLVTSRNTSAWEQAHYDHHANGFRSSSLSEILQRLLLH